MFAAAVLPRLAACGEDDAKIVYDNMKVGASSTDHAAVKSAFENNYYCMGVAGDLVGGLWDTGTNDYYPGAEPLYFELVAGYTPSSQVTDHVRILTSLLLKIHFFLLQMISFYIFP